MCYESVKQGCISEYLLSFIIHQGGYLFILFLDLMYERLSEGIGFPGTNNYTEILRYGTPYGIETFRLDSCLAIGTQSLLFPYYSFRGCFSF
jgi:hypothetical protein